LSLILSPTSKVRFSSFLSLFLLLGDPSYVRSPRKMIVAWPSPLFPPLAVDWVFFVLCFLLSPCERSRSFMDFFFFLGYMSQRSVDTFPLCPPVLAGVFDLSFLFPLPMPSTVLPVRGVRGFCWNLRFPPWGWLELRFMPWKGSKLRVPGVSLWLEFLAFPFSRHWGFFSGFPPPLLSFFFCCAPVVLWSSGRHVSRRHPQLFLRPLVSFLLRRLSFTSAVLLVLEIISVVSDEFLWSSGYPPPTLISPLFHCRCSFPDFSPGFSEISIFVSVVLWWPKL